MSADIVDRTLSIASVLLALCSAGVAMLVYRRDRPRLAFNYSISVRPNGEDASLDVVVVNDGRQPIGLSAVRVADARPSPRWARLLLAPLRPGGFSDRRVSTPPSTGLVGSTVLSPGESAELGFPIETLVELGEHSLYLVAIDTLGREVSEPLTTVVTDAVARARASST